MAEFVDRAVCQIQAELEETPFLSLAEKREVIKRRTRYEYRLRKRTKQEMDCLQYIEYEKAVLKILRDRKRKQRSNSKPEVPVIIRIHNLYELCLKWFPRSISTWQSHIEFCKVQNENKRIGRVYNSMLQANNSIPELWLEAANWHLGKGNLEGARNFMQRCVRFNARSVFAWVENYRMELNIAKMLRGNEKEVDESDPSLNGAAAEVVYKHACQTLGDNIELWLSLVNVAEGFSFARSQKETLTNQMKERFSNSPRMWDFAARSLLIKKKVKLAKMKLTGVYAVYEEAVKKAPCAEMWTLYLKACLEFVAIPNSSEDIIQKRAEKAMETFKRAHEEKMLSVDMFVEWVCLLETQLEMDEAMRVSELLVQQYPASPKSWCQRMKFLFMTMAPCQEIIAFLNKAISSVPEQESWCVWDHVLKHLIARDDCNRKEVESLMEKACFVPYKEVCIPAKILYLRYTTIRKDIKAVRSMYKRVHMTWFNSLEFYIDYAKRELMEDTVNMKRVRKAFEDALIHFGKTDPDVWLWYMGMEMKTPHVCLKNRNFVHERALMELPEGPLRDKYMEGYNSQCWKNWWF